MKVGDKIVYPMHGAGEIVGIEENEVGGVTKSYYILKVPMSSSKLMLPVDKISEMGLREIIDKSYVKEVEKVLRDKSEVLQGSWNKRYHANLDRMKTGNILDVAAIARNLTRQSLIKKVSSGEQRLLDSARQVLISELMYALDKPIDEITAWIDEKINSYVEENSEVVE